MYKNDNIHIDVKWDIDVLKKNLYICGYWTFSRLLMLNEWINILNFELIMKQLIKHSWTIHGNKQNLSKANRV